MTLFILTIITLYILLELLVLFIIFFEKNNIPWLITSIDKYPVLDNDGLKKFTDTSFHPKLGWWRPPLSYGEEKGVNGKVFFSIDSDGSRKKIFNTLPSKIATFGDSFAFCRQVNDDQTWQSNLAKKFNINIQNFGVGNFGLDQALLRYSLCELSNDTELIIVMFVPETICRVQSHWKHYLEFGNTFAFKPMFKIVNHEELIEISNPMKGLKDFKNYRLHLKNIQKNDRFYNEKFKPSIIRFPFFLNGFKYMNFKLILIKYAFIRIWTKILKNSTNKIDEQIMKYVMRCNLKQSYALYNENKSTQLLTMLFRKFKHKVTLKNKKVVFVVAPQLLDLELRKVMNELPYEKFYQNLKTEFDVIDLTQDLSNLPLEKLYVNDIYGGHFSEYGNDAVAKLLEKKIELK